MTSTSAEANEKRPIVFRLLSHALLAAGFLLLMLDIRFEHREVLSQIQISWLPILFSMAMIVLIPCGALLWNRGGKYLLAVCYVGAMIVGALGIYFHAGGELLTRLQDLLSVWQGVSSKNGGAETYLPPILAPFAFLGLGMFGLLFVFFDRASIVDTSKNTDTTRILH